jgi:hypothetical protein
MTSDDSTRNKQLTLTVHPTFNSTFIASINVPDDGLSTTSDNANQLETILIIDRSGSMGSHYNKVITRFLPLALDLLGYNEHSKKIKLITFDSVAEISDMTVDQMRMHNGQSRGVTNMIMAISYLKAHLLSLRTGVCVRILAISDGEIDSQTETVVNTSQLASDIVSMGLTINAQCIRLFTSASQPDTRDLASILQLSTQKGNSASVTDILATTDEKIFAETIVSLFQNDGLNRTTKLTTADKSLIIQVNPWSDPTYIVTLVPGANTFWLSYIPSTPFIIDGSNASIDVIVSSPLTEENFTAIIGPQVNFFSKKIKVLKVINTESAKSEINQIMGYFTDIEKKLFYQDTSINKLLQNPSLKTRIEYFKKLIQRKKKSIVSSMAQIANDDRVSMLNAAQQADYLRSIVKEDKNAKNLAKRAERCGLNFTETVQAEAIKIAENLHQLQGIDDSDHARSFYSQETTLGGIRAVADLANQGLIHDLDCCDILQLINIVGIACSGQIGNYASPLCWRADEIFPNCFLSVSDLTMACLQSGNSDAAISPPGFPNKKITNVIPVFDDNRVFLFMKKFCPSILEFSASIGMRRLIVGVPMTNTYTIVAGLWALVPVLNKDKSNLVISTWTNLVNTFDLAIGPYFDPVMPYLVDQDPKMSYYIGNNGLTNMISPMYRLIKDGNMKNMGRILRAIYSYEIYQVVRLQIKNHPDDNKATFIRETLNKLLSVDPDQFGTEPKDLFVDESNPVFHEEWSVDMPTLATTCDSFNVINSMFLLPSFLAAAAAKSHDETVRQIRAVPPLSDELICNAMEIKAGCTLSMYQLYSVVQSFLFDSKQARVDDDGHAMKIIDLQREGLAKKMVSNYVRHEYTRVYNMKLQLKKVAEIQEMKNTMVTALINAKSMEEFNELFNTGVTIGNHKFQIINSSSNGADDLKIALLDETRNVDHRLSKICVFLLGTDENGRIIWNKGSGLRLGLNDWAHLFVGDEGEARWAYLKEMIKMRVYVYRGSWDQANRHGHHNDKPSYWALGYPTINDMRHAMSSEEWAEYVDLHRGCCGL